jgi:two-component system chemotaxis response regulator CheY
MKTKILAIDDSKTIRSLLKYSLETAGFECHVAVDGEDGLIEYDKVLPDVVITDINMPKKDGFGVIDGLRADKNTKIPILVLTTESSDDLKQRARDAGATGWIVKPFDDEALISVIRRLTGKAA